jgi:hypothetical protein
MQLPVLVSGEAFGSKHHTVPSFVQEWGQIGAPEGIRTGTPKQFP